MLQLQDILIDIASDKPLADTLTRLCREVDSRFSGILCSVTRVDYDLRLRPYAWASLPASYVDALDGTKVGPSAGSCGSAAYHGEPVIAKDVEIDLRWYDFHELVTPLGIHACWSHPIQVQSGEIVGTFAMYAREKRGPNALELSALENCAYLCAVAFGNEQARVAEFGDFPMQQSRSTKLRLLSRRIA